MQLDIDLINNFSFAESNPNSDFFRARDLSTYISRVQLHNGQHIYRSVFEKSEITHMLVDFSFFNKKFDEEDWSAKIEFILYRLEGDEPEMLDATEINRDIKMQENIITVSDSYGSSEPGEKWDKGIYRYEALINGDIVQAHDFYVNDFGRVMAGENPYFNIYSLRLFESGAEPKEYGDRHYLQCFRSDATRYVWAELEIENLLQGNEWVGEFTFRYYNDAMLPIGERKLLANVNTKSVNKAFRVEAGLGHETQVSWFHDKYTVELWFMGVKLAATAFEVGDKEVYGTNRLDVIRKKADGEPEKDVRKSVEKESDAMHATPVQGVIPNEEVLLGELNGMVGLEAIRQKISEYIAYVKFRNLLSSKGADSEEPVNLHACFMGNPGTGKTTVARALGNVYKSLGLLSTSRVFEADRSTLIGRFIGDTAPMVRDVIEKARGGILFIDEAYALSRKHDEKDFGKEALEIILKEMSDGPGDLAVIVAGYPKEMAGFLESNPGLRSRFQNIYEFPDYLPDELMQIARIKTGRKKLRLTAEAEYVLLQKLTEEYRNRDRTFGNARLVGSFIEAAQLNLGIRIMKHRKPEKLPLETICTITEKDVEGINLKPGVCAANLPINEELLKGAMLRLNEMVGIASVKQEINDLVKLVRYQKEINKDVLNSLSLHNVFLGNPGTGKTTIARLMAQIFKALGLLERGHLIECNREKLVAGHVGQTAIKTEALIDSAIGGVLFIDEAYALFTPGSAVDFGSEAIETLLKRMEDDRGRFAVIMAGYTKEMQLFLDSNPGLRSRIDNHILFEDYSTEELGQIACIMLKQQGLSPTKEAMDVLQEYFGLHALNKDRFFGNARFVRKVIEKAVKNQLLRMGSTLPEERTLEMMQALIKADVEEFERGTDLLQSRKPIGFTLHHGRSTT